MHALLRFLQCPPLAITALLVIAFSWFVEAYIAIVPIFLFLSALSVLAATGLYFRARWTWIPLAVIAMDLLYSSFFPEFVPGPDGYYGRSHGDFMWRGAIYGNWGLCAVLYCLFVAIHLYYIPTRAGGVSLNGEPRA